MIVFGLLSSAFDVLTFVALRLLFDAGDDTFQDDVVRRLAANRARRRVSTFFGFVSLSTVEMETVVRIVIAYRAATEIAKVGSSAPKVARLTIRSPTVSKIRDRVFLPS
jgi:hypothetical protein